MDVRKQEIHDCKLQERRINSEANDFLVDSRSYIKSEAVLKIMEYIDLPFPQLAILLQFVPL